MSIYQLHYGHLLITMARTTIAPVFPLLLLFHLWRIRKPKNIRHRLCEGL
jgi:hypothetical protein